MAAALSVGAAFGGRGAGVMIYLRFFDGVLNAVFAARVARGRGSGADLTAPTCTSDEAPVPGESPRKRAVFWMFELRRLPGLLFVLCHTTACFLATSFALYVRLTRQKCIIC